MGRVCYGPRCPGTSVTFHNPRCQLNQKLGPISDDPNTTVTLYQVSLFSIKYEKNIAFDITPFEKS